VTGCAEAMYPFSRKESKTTACNISESCSAERLALKGEQEGGELVSESEGQGSGEEPERQV
jgi:hypothetical protein